MFLFLSADFLQNKVFTNKSPGTTIGVSNSLDPDQDCILLVFIWVQTVCKRLLADDKILSWHAKSYNRYTIILSNIGSFQL